MIACKDLYLKQRSLEPLSFEEWALSRLLPTQVHTQWVHQLTSTERIFSHFLIKTNEWLCTELSIPVYCRVKHIWMTSDSTKLTVVWSLLEGTFLPYTPCIYLILTVLRTNSRKDGKQSGKLSAVPDPLKCTKENTRILENLFVRK